MYFFFSSTAACGPRCARTVTVRVRFSEAGEVSSTLSRPGSALALRADGDVPFDDARTRDCLPSQLERTTGGGPRERGFPPSNRQSRTPPERPTDAGGRTVPGRTARRRGSRTPAGGCIGLAEYPVYDPQTGVARDPRVTEAAMCVRLVDVRITCGLHDDAQIAAVFIDPRAK